jgi:murein DD-endopeptidase MepM/ murein hydrolase activator NlpD
MNSKDPNSMLNVLGVDKSSPIRSNFRFNSSENRKLESTEEGLVGGYNVSLRTTAALNDAYSVMADTLGPVNDGLMTLKGILQTLPNAGNMGGAISGFVGALAGLTSTILQVALVSRLLGGGSIAGLLGKGAGLAGGLAAGAAATGAGLAAGAVGFGVGKGGKALGNKLGTSNTVTRAGSTLAGAGAGAAIGTMILPGVGTVVGSVVGGLGGFFGSGGPSDHGNFGIGGESPTSYPSPVPAKTPVTSPFGPRDNSKHPGISANHRGIDFGTTVGTALTAVAPGVVSVVGNDPDGYGSWIEVKHEDGTASRYGHLSQINVSKGQEVKPGQVVARSGGKPGTAGAGSSTGPHVHFEILNQKGVKIDPAPYLSGSPAGPIESATPAIPGPEPIGSDSMWAAKKAATNAAANLGKDATQLSSIGLSSSLTSSGFNEDLGGPATGGPMGGMNVGVASSSGESKNVVINLQMKVSIAQGSVQEADRLVRLVGKKLTDSDVLKKIGSAL